MNDQEKNRLAEIQDQLAQLRMERKNIIDRVRVEQESIIALSVSLNPDHTKILISLMGTPKMPMARIAAEWGWLLSNGKPYTAKVFRNVTEMEEMGLVKRNRKGKVRIASQGIAKLIQKD
jgi:hypothetical protein